MAARRVLRGIYGEELEAELRRQGLDIDSRTFAVPRFGAAKYQGLSDTDLLQQFRERVDSAEPDSCLVNQRRSSGQTRLEQIVADSGLENAECPLHVSAVTSGDIGTPHGAAMPLGLARTENGQIFYSDKKPSQTTWNRAERQSGAKRNNAP